jgi:hypothetical protein
VASAHIPAETIVSASIQVRREMTGIRIAQTCCAAKFIGNRVLQWHPTAKTTILTFGVVTPASTRRKPGVRDDAKAGLSALFLLLRLT